jgi:RNA polymerase sigma-70 factor (ECF subfamily)
MIGLESDEALMQRVVAGEMAALGLLFERYRAPLFGFLFRLLQSQTAAEDVLQDAFLRLYDRRRHYRAGQRFSTWLYTIAHHLAIDALRATSRKGIVLDQVEELPVAAEMLPAAQAERGEVADAVRRAVTRLPREQRVALVLREYEGFSYREIGVIVGISEQAARVRTHRARLTLREALAPLLHEDACEMP